MIRAIVGANWGDEGKGKITDVCAENSDIVVRFQGGSNAGHTIINEYGKFALHQLPSGVFRENTLNIIGNGSALNIDYLLKEIEYVEKANIKFNLKVSDRAGVLAPYHVLLDELEEARLKDKKFGSTKSGIAPFYSDKYSKVGFQVWELFEKEYLKEKVDTVCEKLNIIMEHLYNAQKLNPEDLYNTFISYGEKIAPYVADTSKILNDAIKENKSILLEGQLGALRDIDHGIYPYVTSSSTLAGYAAVGAGIPPYEIKEIMAITKAYSSSVGEGPFVVNLEGNEAEELRRRGGDAGEYGATTGRARDVGYFDAVATKYGCKVQGATELVITCLDVLGYLDEIPVCIAYEIDGETVTDFATTAKLNRAKPIYTKLPGWKKDISGIKNYDELPQEVKNYIKFIEEKTETKVKMVSNGPKRDDVIYLA